MHCADWNEDTMTDVIRRWLAVAIKRECVCYICVMAVNPKKNTDQDRREDENDPGPVTELRDGKDQHDKAGTQRAKSIAEHFDEPVFFVMQFMARMLLAVRIRLVWVQSSGTPPAPCHSKLRQRKG